jgi:hypothetical protein
VPLSTVYQQVPLDAAPARPRPSPDGAALRAPATAYSEAHVRIDASGPIEMVVERCSMIGY